MDTPGGDAAPSSPGGSSGPSSSGPGSPQFNPITGSLGVAPPQSPSSSSYGPSGYGSSGYSPSGPSLPPSGPIRPQGLGALSTPAPTLSLPSGMPLPPPSGPIGGNSVPLGALSGSLPSGGFGGSLSSFSGLSNASSSTASSSTASSLGAPPAMPSGTPLPPASGPVGSGSSVGSGGLSLPSGTPLPPANSVGNAPLSLTNPLRQPPLIGAKIDALKAGASQNLSKTYQDFENNVGLLPASMQASATALFNKINGTNFPVPGTQTPPMLPNGQQALGPPSITQPYSPNALQASTIGKNNAESTAIGDNYGLKLSQFKSQQAYQSALMSAKQQEIGLQRQGLDERTAHDSVMAGIAQQNASGRGLGRAGGGASGVAGDALTARLNQRMTTLTMLGKSDMFGKPTAPLVTLDAQGNPSGPGAGEYRNLLSLMSSRPVNPLGGGFQLRGVGSQVPSGTSAPYAPPLPRLPSRRPASTGRFNPQDWMK